MLKLYLPEHAGAAALHAEAAEKAKGESPPLPRSESAAAVFSPDGVFLDVNNRFGSAWRGGPKALAGAARFYASRWITMDVKLEHLEEAVSGVNEGGKSDNDADADRNAPRLLLARVQHSGIFRERGEAKVAAPFFGTRLSGQRVSFPGLVYLYVR